MMDTAKHNTESTGTAEEDTKGLDWLLQEFIQQVPGVEGALLATRDGLKLAVAGLEKDPAEKCGAIITGLYSLAKAVGPEVKGTASGEVEQINVRSDAGHLFAMSAGTGPSLRAGIKLSEKSSSVLGVLTSLDADEGLVGYEMVRLIQSFSDHLETPIRKPEG